MSDCEEEAEGSVVSEKEEETPVSEKEEDAQEDEVDQEEEEEKADQNEEEVEEEEVVEKKSMPMMTTLGPGLTDEELDSALENFAVSADNDQLEELLKTMNENNIIAWDEAERILSYGDKGVVKSGLPEQVRPNDDENETDVGDATAKAAANDPNLKKVNLNNMKVSYPLQTTTRTRQMLGMRRQKRPPTIPTSRKSTSTT